MPQIILTPNFDDESFKEKYGRWSFIVVKNYIKAEIGKILTENKQ